MVIRWCESEDGNASAFELRGLFFGLQKVGDCEMVSLDPVIMLCTLRPTFISKIEN